MIFLKRRRIDSEKGFTLLEMVVSATIIVLMSTFVLASFRAARYSGELDVVVQQVVNGISTVQVKGVSGNLEEYPIGSGTNVYPNDGYGMKVLEAANSFSLYGLHVAVLLDEEEVTFQDVIFSELCGLEATTVVLPVCSAGWSSEVALELLFNLDGNVVFRDGAQIELDYEYIGGILTHQGTNKRAYFYVPASTGIAIGDLLD